MCFDCFVQQFALPLKQECEERCAADAPSSDSCEQSCSNKPGVSVLDRTLCVLQCKADQQEEKKKCMDVCGSLDDNKCRSRCADLLERHCDDYSGDEVAKCLAVRSDPDFLSTCAIERSGFFSRPVHDLCVKTLVCAVDG